MINRFVIVETFREPKDDFGYIKIWYYRKNRQEKQIRIIESDGNYIDMFYDEDGKLHRDGDLPAMCDTRGYQKFYYHGVVHRGHFSPAIIHRDGSYEYWVFGEKRGESFSAKRQSGFR